MQRLDFQKYKYGKELLIDCFYLPEIEAKIISSGEMHATSFYEVFLFLKGQGAVTLDGTEYHFKGPAVILLPPSQPRKWNLKITPDSMILIFEGEFMELFLKDNLFLNRLYYFGSYGNAPVLPVSRSEADRLKLLFDRAKQEINHWADDSQHLLRAYLYELLILLNRMYATHYQLSGNLYRNTDILHFKKLLREHIQEKQTVNEYAALLQMNRNRLNQLCQDTFGKTALTLIHSELVQSCKNELLTTAKTVAEIGYDYNFSATSNFVRFFKKVTGQSPAAYRNQFIPQLPS
ncbi:AraC-type DNA-binding protein [Filimonas lacunae]|uniref:AraC-type DNA-binding protein n=1 Tax=Filimonas lacunae TaxID=477680 RepID=A0A173MH37_9BACT|nr:AraC family transcriptional regulator [Filimonas lacunae]BAV06741.1 transcriptional regulator, AraC family [Filimonas lacunae]SIT34433.1 AraC-type DNA-binding protein [Filimonas lacunae]